MSSLNEKVYEFVKNIPRGRLPLDYRIIVAVMQGKTPPEMTLAKAVNTLPEDWQEQRKLLGMA